MLSRDFVIVLGGRLAIACIGLLAIRAVTTFLSPEEYGYLALLFMVQQLCGMFLVNPVGQYINRHTHVWWEDGTLLSRLRPYRVYVIAVSIIGALVMYAVAERASGEASFLSAIVLMLMVVAGTWSATWVSRLNVLGFRYESMIWGILTVVCGLLLSVCFMQWHSNAIFWFFGQALGMVVGAVGAGKLMRKYSHAAEHQNLALPINTAAIASYCLPLAVATGFMWIQLSGYRFVIESYWGLAQLGYITVGLTLAAQVWAACESLAMQFLYPYFFKSISDDKHESGKQALSDLLNVLGPLYLILAGLTVIAAPLLIFLLVDEKFSDAVIFVMMGAILECCRALANVFGNAAQVTRKTRSLALPYASGAIILLIVLFMAGVNQAGTTWVGVGLVSGGLVMLIVMIFAMYKQVAFVLEWKIWLIGFLGMISLSALSFWFGKLNTWVEAIESMGFVTIAAVLLAAAVLWKNLALKRLLQVRLSEKGNGQ